MEEREGKEMKGKEKAERQRGQETGKAPWSSMVTVKGCVALAAVGCVQ